MSGGHVLQVQGVSVEDIAEEFGTPVFVYDARLITDVYRELRRLVHPAVDIFYSLKANPNISVCALLGSLGAGAEVSSHAELVTALRAGVDPADVIFLGPGKSRVELSACVEAGIHAVVCESIDELRLLDELADGPAGHSQTALLRVNPDFATKGSGLTMGGKARQFGIDVETVRRSCRELRALRNVRVAGVHAYLGTRFLDAADIVSNTRGVLATAEALADECGIELGTVDVGGGLGVAYFEGEKQLDLEQLALGLDEVVGQFRERHPACRVIMELGRYLTAPAGLYVVRARYVKESMGELFVVADGGTNHHMAAVGVGSFVRRNFPIRVLNRLAELPAAQYTVTGPLCTPNDTIGRRVALPRVRPGDLIGVERSGAYGPTASPGLFLSHGYPAEVLVVDGRAALVRERDTVADLLAKQRLVPVASRGRQP